MATQRPLDVAHDLQQVLAVADMSGLNVPHVADWPYRFSSWATVNPDNTQVWLDDNSCMLGWAAMQTPFWAIDCVVAHDAPAMLYSRVLSWAKSRASELSAAGQGRPMWFLAIDAARQQQCRELEAQGFQCLRDAGEDSWTQVLLELEVTHEIEPVRLPDGLRLRNLDPETETQCYVDLHREVFQSDSMTYDWRARSTRMQGYHNALDLVLVSDDGELQGFCVGWLRRLATGEVVGQIEPMGMRESHRGNKLSRQLLTEAINRLQALGATRIVVETDAHRTAALAAYNAMGFVVSREVLVYRHSVATL